MTTHLQQLWVSEQHVPWLIQYMATEHALGGIKEQPNTPGEGSDSAVPGSKIEWDWSGKDGYRAFVNGSEVRCAISTFSQEKWDKVAAIHQYDTTFPAASKEEIGQACHDYLLQYLESLSPLP